MPQTTGPFALTADTAIQITDPSNAPWVGVVLSNLSPYLLEVQSGVGAYWLAPWTEQLYTANPSHQPVNVFPTVPAGTTPAAETGAQLQVTWYASGEVPQGSWPISLVANAIAAAIAGLTFTGGNANINLAAIQGTPPVTGSPFAGVTTLLGPGTPVNLPSQAVKRGAAFEADPNNVGLVGIGVSSGSQPVSVAPGGWFAGMPVSNLNLLWIEGTNGDHLEWTGV